MQVLCPSNQAPRGAGSTPQGQDVQFFLNNDPFALVDQFTGVLQAHYHTVHFDANKSNYVYSE
jgi:hypothetical protein